MPALRGGRGPGPRPSGPAGDIQAARADTARRMPRFRGGRGLSSVPSAPSKRGGYERAASLSQPASAGADAAPANPLQPAHQHGVAQEHERQLGKADRAEADEVGE